MRLKAGSLVPVHTFSSSTQPHCQFWHQSICYHPYFLSLFFTIRTPCPAVSSPGPIRGQNQRLGQSNLSFSPATHCSLNTVQVFPWRIHNTLFKSFFIALHWRVHNTPFKSFNGKFMTESHFPVKDKAICLLVLAHSVCTSFDFMRNK